MITFHESLFRGYEMDGNSFRFTFGENNEYELWFEALLFDKQYYVALYHNHNLLTDKVVVKPGKEDEEEWVCDVCKRQRSDKDISVVTYPLTNLQGALRNLKYCNDEPNCMVVAGQKAMNGALTP